MRLHGPRQLTGRRGAACRVGAWAAPGFDPVPGFDPDAYEEEHEDDDDDAYLHPGDSPMAPRVPARSPVEGLSGPSRGPRAGAKQTPEAHPRPRSTVDVPHNSLALALVVGAAIHRLLTRLQTAVLATVLAAWQLGREAVHSLRHSTVQAKTQAGEAFKAAHDELPEDLWGKVMWVWDRPPMQKIRLTISMANFSFRLPALAALVATQIGLLSTSLSLPMLAPLLLGTGMLMRSIRTNASLVFPRIGLLVVLLWLLWFANSVIQNTVAYLRKQGAIDQRMANNINSIAELTVLVTAGVILLSMLGVKVSALLLPAGVAAAIASRDLSHNFCSGCFIMMVQPFRLGDRVGVALPAGSPGTFGGGSSWFEGVCEKVDLRYTSLRQGKRRLMVPNSAFLQQPFMILEDTPQGGGSHPEYNAGPTSVTYAQQEQQQQAYMPPDDQHVWQSYVDGMPLHQELAEEAAGPQATAGAQASTAATAAAAGPPSAPWPLGLPPLQEDRTMSLATQQEAVQQQQQQSWQQREAQKQQQPPQPPTSPGRVQFGPQSPGGADQ